MILASFEKLLGFWLAPALSLELEPPRLPRCRWVGLKHWGMFLLATGLIEEPTLSLTTPDIEGYPTEGL